MDTLAHTPTSATAPQQGSRAGSGGPTTGPHHLSAGLDIGGTKVEGVLLDAEGKILASETRPTIRGPEGVADTALAVLASMLSSIEATHKHCAGIGVGIPGLIDTSTGTVRNAVNLDVEELPLGQILESATLLPSTIDNDVNVAALGAVHALGVDGRAVYLNIGTGMAAALVSNGHLCQGATGAAGEIGHLPVNPAGRPCKCGQVGCIETMASGGAIAELWPSSELHPSDALLAAAELGDPEATQIFGGVADGIAQAIRVIFLTYDPDLVILGGGLRRLGGPLFDRIAAGAVGAALMSRS